MVYRADGDLSDVQCIGQIDIAAAMRAAIETLRDPPAAIDDAGTAYLECAEKPTIETLWPILVDALLTD